MDAPNRSSGTTRPPPRGRTENAHALPKGTLPKKLQLFFAPRLPLQHLPPMKKKKPALPYTGVAQYLCHFEEKKTEDQTSPSEKNFRNPEYAFQCRIDGETKMEKLIRMRKMKIEENVEKVKKAMSEWDPNKDTRIQGDPFKTLFVARMSYAATERHLKKVFGEYGPIRSVRICRDSTTDKSRGYAFIEFEHLSDMKDAYKHADGTKIEGRRVLVDVERGRTMEGWRPARLGGGLGAQSRRPKSKRTQRAEKPPKEAERESRPRGREEHDRESGRYHESRREEGRSRGNREYQRERDYGSHERSRRSDRGKSERRYYDHRSNHDERSGKKKRELEEGEVDHGEVREMRRRERDM